MSLGLTQKRKDQISKEVLKLRREPENLKCVDCSNRNCSYVCVNFNTFICSDCAGLYRKHCFRVKSCTVATFSEKEYENLKTSGGNEACNRKYMAKWKKKSEFPLPKQGDLKALDAFIHKKYVLKEWYKDVKEKKKKRKRKKKVDDYEKKDGESKTKSKPPSSTGSKQSQENQQLERDFLESEAALETKDNDWDPWGEKSAEKKAAEPLVQQAPPQDDFLSGFVFDTPTQTPNKSSDDWNPFGSSSKQTPEIAVAAAPPKAVHEKKQSVDLIEELLSNMNVTNTKNNHDLGIGRIETETKKAPPVKEKPKSPYNDPFSNLISSAPAPQPVASSTTSPQLQVRAAPPPTQQQPVPVNYPMYMNTFGPQYGMVQPAPAAQMNPYGPQYNMAPQQVVNPFDTQVPTNVGPMMGQMPFNNSPQVQMNAYNYQMAAFDIIPASQVSQDNPFS